MTGRALVLHGVRGSMAVGGAGSRRHGGATTCYSVEVEPGRLLVVDAGTGLRDLQHRLVPGRAYEFTVFLTHYHLDHVIGLPLFEPLHDPANRFTFYGAAHGGLGPAEALTRLMGPPLFPVSLEDVEAPVEFHDLPRKPVTVGDVTVSHAALHHPQGCTGYRLQAGGRSIVVATDHEFGTAADGRLDDLAAGAGVLLHDAQYLPGEVEGIRKGWGHSSYEAAAAAAHRAGVRRLVLVSHDPERTDDEVDDIVVQARRRFPTTWAGHAGMSLPL
jgi:phosphoribosyl 1,2-cyclic phosphodiesterase